MIQVNLDFADEEFRKVLREEIQLAILEVVSENEYPPLLTRKNLEEIFQVEANAVTKIVSIEGFPKFEFIRARYPRDAVMDWINKNSIVVNSSRTKITSGGN